MIRFSLRSALTSAIVLGAAALLPQSAAALCAAHPTLDTGRYVNVDRSTRSITTMDLQFVCGSLHRDNGDGTATIIHDADPHWRVRLYGSCHPTDCDWGQARADEARGRGLLLAAYDQGFANRDIRVIPDNGDVLLIVTSTYNDGRAPRTSVNRMHMR